MISNVCKIEKGVKDLGAILRESEKVAVYNELNAKQAGQLRLLCEEVNGLLPNIVDDFDGEIWIEFEEGVCRVNVNIHFYEFTTDKKKQLIALAKNKKNAAAVGVVGKIRSAIENIFLAGNNVPVYDMATQFQFATAYSVGADYSCMWSLNGYRRYVKEEKVEEYDELEKSIIASIADDVVVGVKGKDARIVIVKKFA